LILDRDTAPAIAPWDNWRKSLPNERLCRVSMLSILVLLATALTSGCMSVPTDAALRATNAVLPVSKVAVDIDVDGRSRFRDFFCTLAEDHGVSAARRQNNCDALLWRLSDEAPSAGKVQPAPFDTSLQIFVVGGAFSSCFGSASTVFPKAIERLSAKGYAIDTLAVNSRSSADYNASMIATSLADISEAPIILVGYSKGAVDIAHFLVNYPEIAARVVAVLSLAGPLMGSEIAAYGKWYYDTLFSDSFAGRCDPGDGGVLDSLQPQVRREWIRAHPLPRSVRFYTLLAFGGKEHIARALIPTWEILASTDPRNDGQLTLAEGTWPNSTLLGYANADHWGVAIEIEKEFDFLASRPDETPYPRGVLLEAALRFISEDLRDFTTAQDNPVANR